MRSRKLHHIHFTKRILWDGIDNDLAQTLCGLRVSTRLNRQRLTQQRREVTCRRCRQIHTPPLQQ